MTNRGFRRSMSATIICSALVGAVATAGCSELFGPSAEPGCTDRDERLAERLDDLAVLDLRPAGATLQEQGVGCDESTGVVIVDRIYRLDGTADDVVADAAAADKVAEFYRLALSEAGWKLAGPSSSPVNPRQPAAVELCFSTVIEDADARLYVSFPGFSEDGLSDLGRRDFVLSVIADADPDPDGRSSFTICS